MHLTALLGLCASTASAINLYVSDYAGNVTTLEFLQESSGNYSLKPTYVNPGCAPNPSWLTLDSHSRLLFCANEGLSSANGSLTTFTINSNGSLTSLSNTTTLSGPVSSVVYGNTHDKAIALAHYSGSAVSSYLLRDSKPAFSHQFPLTLPHPGVDPERQDAPHAHEVLTDPTGQYLLSPDLGSDLIHIFAINPESLALTPCKSIPATPGSGPRHGVFYNPTGFPNAGGKTYFYLVEELSGHISSYEVSYLPNQGGLSFTGPLQSENATWLFNVPGRNAPAEIEISPDNRFLIVSNRNSTAFTLPTIGDSDSISTWTLDPKSGAFNFLQLWPSSGAFPRHFSISKTGQFVAVGLQSIQTVAILQRDVATGLIGEPVARVEVSGNVTAVVWDDEWTGMGWVG
ncbi:unnamed protein product [Zymoseptoria tritici ST99CH_1E4]|uniref:6-phosphogluconolactonase n=1 Tax=Zymoseptoria tritici ST99CH_1E4 TaxID=1276532 RepID=A0A2H1H8H3_ZYMTR|nr:unnamed protein product [Zymoseptoria tritici ST99CH_1E4]